MNTVDKSMDSGNTTGKCLLDNWVEERAVAPLDNLGSQEHVGEAQTHRYGHKGILSVDLISKVADITTVRESYTSPRKPGIKQRGIREELLEKYLYKTISEQVLEECNPGSPPRELISTTRHDYKMEGFKSVPPSPSKKHDLKSEQAITYWSENYQKLQGVTPVRSRDTPFKKNSSFSKPISEYLDEPMPYTLENYPNL
ncbi:sperm-associated antigen 8 [Lepisosteus oculatus]|uniref:Sperm associated antigen 8 n=1 Tax=Lepisosteus oculatus TaxID=7918 RepID=W5MWT8_LEPOC|nr:PREDICTED: sperm-associated antigen 8 [Lepisosteus oculatus]